MCCAAQAVCRYKECTQGTMKNAWVGSRDTTAIVEGVLCKAQSTRGSDTYKIPSVGMKRSVVYKGAQSLHYRKEREGPHNGREHRRVEWKTAQR